jgi:hypothetical protein
MDARLPIEGQEWRYEQEHGYGKKSICHRAPELRNLLEESEGPYYSSWLQHGTGSVREVGLDPRGPGPAWCRFRAALEAIRLA